MAPKRNLPQETPAKKRRLSPDGLAPPAEMNIFQRSPSPESAVANWSRGIRGIFSNIGGGDQTNEVINGATPEPSNLFSAASSAFSTIVTQLPRVPEDVGLLVSIARTKLFKSGVVDDKHYEVGAHDFLPKELRAIMHPRPPYHFFLYPADSAGSSRQSSRRLLPYLQPPRHVRI